MQPIELPFAGVVFLVLSELALACSGGLGSGAQRPPGEVGGTAGASSTSGASGGTPDTSSSVNGEAGRLGSGGAAGASGTSTTDVGSSAAGSTAGSSAAAAVHYVGRFDDSDPAAVRFAWSGTGVVARFEGTSVKARLGGGQQFTVVIDGQVSLPKLVADNGVNTIADGLSAGAHRVELYRRTEASQGDAIFRGFDFGGGKLLAPEIPKRRLEFIGDSITCGYGNEGPNKECPFSPDTENHYLTYAAITARNLGAELSTIAWSGKGVVCNYGDDVDSCTKPLPDFYDRTLPSRSDSLWDFSRFVPDAVVINLGTNDFSTDSDPSQELFETGYRSLLQRVRGKYPNAQILCTIGPLLMDPDLATAKAYIEEVVTAMGDPKITLFEIPPEDGSLGYGCDWHPNLARHAEMAKVVTAALKNTLGW